LIILHQPPGDINNGPLDKMEKSSRRTVWESRETKLKISKICRLVSLFLLMKYGCHVQVGVESFCVNDFPIRAVIFFTLALGIVETLQKKILSHTVCCESMFPTSSNIIFVSCFFQKDNMALWV
jgi:hypothetical protein